MLNKIIFIDIQYFIFYLFYKHKYLDQKVFSSDKTITLLNS